MTTPSTKPSSSNVTVLELPLGPCTKEPARWTLQIDEGQEVFDAKHSTIHPLFRN